MRHALVTALIALAVGPLLGLTGVHAIAATDEFVSGGPASEWSETDHSRLRLVAATTTAVDGDTRLGLQIELKPGWKVYWRSPGDAGFPPKIDWGGSNNLKDAAILWPVPERFSVQGLETLGYKKKVVLPISAVPAATGEGMDLKAHIRYLACDDICIPYEAKLALALPAGTAEPSAHAHAIDKYAARVPGDGRAHGLRIASLEALPGASAGSATLRLIVNSKVPFAAPDAFLEGAPVLAYGKPKVALAEDGMTAKIDVDVSGVDLLEDAKGRTLQGRDFTVTLVDGGRVAERQLAALAPMAAGAPETTGGRNGGLTLRSMPPQAPAFGVIVLLAILGGLILNLMPCVLPVLSLKMLSLVKHGGGEARDVRLGFIASAAGIIATFLALAGILAGLRAGGTVIGWGIQFQQPWFLTALVLLVTIFACNLWGFFEVRLPNFISDLGGDAIHVHGLGGHFLGGVFATLLATPCTAPFLGTAVGFALAGSVAEMLAVFAALSLGLALPYLLVAAVPSLATWLPKPGVWMVRLKFGLGLLLAGTGVWLLVVLAGVAGMTAALGIAALSVAAAALLFVAHRGAATMGARLSMPGILAIGAVALTVPAWIAPGPAPVAGAKDSGAKARLAALWQPFDPAAIPALVGQGKTVFVDVTADWCITCQVNKGVVLSRDDIFNRLRGDDIVAMQADWTRPDDTIARYLASYGRFGIPFNAVYGPKAPNGVVLPELLSQSAVLEAFEAAGAKPMVAKNP